MKSLSLFFVILIFATSAAYSQKVQVDHTKSADFAAYKTFSWDQGQPARNPYVAEIIRAAIENELIARGLTRNDAKADLKIAVMAATGMDLQGIGPSWNNEVYKSWGGYGNPTALMNLTNGTLLIDLVDTKSSGSVWRGVAKDTLDRTLTNDPEADAKHVEKQIKKAVQKMFKKYPVAIRK